MKALTLVFLTLSVLTLLPLSAQSYKTISPDAALALLKANPKAVLLDVRTPEENLASRIPGDILIPDYELAARSPKELPDKAAPIIVYCRSGNRSKTAANRLIAMGYTQVYDLGGIITWPYEKISGKAK
jgi:rhodanese-related sulfurtransferase